MSSLHSLLVIHLVCVYVVICVYTVVCGHTHPCGCLRRPEVDFGMSPPTSPCLNFYYVSTRGLLRKGESKRVRDHVWVGT